MFFSPLYGFRLSIKWWGVVGEISLLGELSLFKFLVWHMKCKIYDLYCHNSETQSKSIMCYYIFLICFNVNTVLINLRADGNRGRKKDEESET